MRKGCCLGFESRVFFQGFWYETATQGLSLRAAWHPTWKFKLGELNCRESFVLFGFFIFPFSFFFKLHYLKGKCTKNFVIREMLQRMNGRFLWRELRVCLGLDGFRVCTNGVIPYLKQTNNNSDLILFLLIQIIDIYNNDLFKISLIWACLF